MSDKLIRRNSDAIYEMLKQAIEKPEKAYLWTPRDTIEFVPHVLPVSFGDGRALFYVGTLNQRPRYWVVRGDSNWECGLDYPGRDDDAPEIVEFIDDIAADIEGAFGSARCGYCGRGLSAYSIDDPPHCDQRYCEAKDELEGGRDWPCINDEGGCQWGRMDWPPGFAVTRSPYYRETILAICASAEVA